MLRALWLNTSFSDGATAQGVATLPQPVRDLLKELEVQGKRYEVCMQLQEALAQVLMEVRLALLQIVFRSVELPEQYHIAGSCFDEKEGILIRSDPWLKVMD